MERAHFAAAQVHDFRTAREQGARCFNVAAFGGLMQLRGGDTIDGCLQLRPAFESVGSREYELGIMQMRTFQASRCGDRSRPRSKPQASGAIGFEQFLRLAFQLIEIGIRAHGASGRVLAHMSSFPGGDSLTNR